VPSIRKILKEALQNNRVVQALTSGDYYDSETNINKDQTSSKIGLANIEEES